MIIKSNTSVASRKRTSTFFKGLTYLTVGALLFFILYLLISFFWIDSSPNKKINTNVKTLDTDTGGELVLLADAETLNENGELVVGQRKTSAVNRSDEQAYEGKYSIKLNNPKAQYGFTFPVHGVKVGDVITAQVWMYATSTQMGNLVISGKKAKELYAPATPEKTIGKWQLLNVSVTINKPLEENLVSIYCFNLNDNPVYFDKLSYSRKSSDSTTITTLIADAETLNKNGELVVGQRKTSAVNRSNEQAYKGKYSIKLHKPHSQYGFTFPINGVKVGDIITAKVWMYATDAQFGALIICGKKAKELYVSSTPQKIVGKWQLLSVSVEIVKPIEDELVSIFCYSETDSPVYFDNLSYSLQSKFPQAETETKQWIPEHVRLHIPDQQYQKLQQLRDDAVKNGILVSTDDSWVKGYIYSKTENEENIKISLRLKGDWTDHLKGDKWSFRIKTPTDKSWNRLKVFSLQRPEARSYLLEWLLHEFFLYEDVLTTRYDFLNVELNNKDMGLYVYEEHFLKQIPEYNKKKEGPIIKFDETSLWEGFIQSKNLGLELIPGEFTSINPFLEGKTSKSPVLAEQFKIAQNLLYQYQFKLKPIKELFDLDLLAKYYAISDITGGYHGAIWHNQRFYYNPVTSKLEPIGYDGFAENQGVSETQDVLGINRSVATNKNQRHLQDLMHESKRHLFTQPDFVAKYLFYLNKFTQKSYINKFINHIRSGFNQRLNFIRKYNSSYNLDYQYLYRRAIQIQNKLFPLNQAVTTRMASENLVAVCNNHFFPIKIIGTALHDNGNIYPLDSSRTILTTPKGTLPDYSQQILVPENAKFLVYQVLGLEDKSYYKAISPWSIPEAFSPAQELKSNLRHDHPAYIYIPEQKRLLFRKNATIDSLIVIPEGFEVVAEPGTQIDITKNAFVLSYSTINFIGTAEQPIIVNSSDKTARAFTVIKAAGYSTVQYTKFSNLGAFSYKGWNLPGAVNFYESNVNIDHSVFTNNSCEDALNIVRANFEFSNNIISHTFADGFDADFCEGQVTNCQFHHIGNDGIDFSTSTVIIKDCHIKGVGDKGISMGEQGTATIINTTIEDATIGIASKDLSKTTVQGAILKNCKTGFAAYQKKPEYGHGFIYVEKYSAENLGSLYKILPGSYLKLLDKEIKGD